MDSNVLNDRILSIDIFKLPKKSRSTKLPEYSERILFELQNSLKNIRDEALQKLQSTNDDASKVLSELESSLNAILMKNLMALKSKANGQKLIKLGALYEFASRNNNSLKKYLNSFYLTSRVYKGLLKNHPLIQDLQFRLLNVRRKVILETYKNEARKGKLHHLRSSKAVRTVSNIPKRLKYIVKKCNKEIMKCMSKDATMNLKQAAELRQLLGEGKDCTAEYMCQSMEDSLIDYYGRMQPDHEKTNGYITSLMEISEAQNKQGENVLLNYCDQEMAMEYLCLESDDVRQDYTAWDYMVVGGDTSDGGKHHVVKNDAGRKIQINLTEDGSIDSRPKEVKVEQVQKVETEEADVLDFEDFQLVDEWESRADDDKKCDDNVVSVVPVSVRSVTKDEMTDGKGAANESCSRRRRRTRFGPVTEEFIMEQMQQGNLGFSSTFVDEDDNGGSVPEKKVAPVSMAAVEKDRNDECNYAANNDRVMEEKKEKIIEHNKDDIREKKRDELKETNEEIKQNKVEIKQNKDENMDEKKKDYSREANFESVERKRSFEYKDHREDRYKDKRVDKDDKIKKLDKKEVPKRQMFDVVAKVDEENVKMETECAPTVPLTRGDLCKSMLTKFHDTLCSLLAVSRNNVDWANTVTKITEPWSVTNSSHGLEHKSLLAEQVAQEAFKELESRLETIIREKVPVKAPANEDRDTPQAYGGTATDSTIPSATIPMAYSSMSDQSPSPTSFDQSIEASMTKSRGSAVTPWHPLVAPRPTKIDGKSSPERSRFRAMMLSYKRDVTRQKEDSISKEKEASVTAVDKKEEGECEDHGAVNDELPIELPAPAIQTKTEKTTLVATRDMTDVVVVREKGRSDSEGMLSSSDEGDVEAPKAPAVVVQPRETQSKVQWLASRMDKAIPVPLPPPAAPFCEVAEPEEEGSAWIDRKVFVVDAHDPRDAVAPLVRAHLHHVGARVFDAGNYKQAGKGLHVLVHNDWRFPDSCVAPPLSSPVSLLFLKNNSGVHFLSYPDLDAVVRFDCSTIFPHSRTCVFLDHQALAATHPDNIRNMLQFMVTERETSDRIWCLKIVASVYEDFCNKLSSSSGQSEEVLSRWKDVQRVLVEEYSGKYGEEDESLSLVEIVNGHGTDNGGGSGDRDDTMATGSVHDHRQQQDQVLAQQYHLQRKFRHFCILTEDLNTTELDIRSLSTYGVAVLPLRTFLTNKIKKYVD